MKVKGMEEERPGEELKMTRGRLTYFNFCNGELGKKKIPTKANHLVLIQDRQIEMCVL